MFGMSCGQTAQWFVTCVSVSFVLVHASPLKWCKQRLLDIFRGHIPEVVWHWIFEMNTCLYCTGFWVGAVCGFAFATLRKRRLETLDG